jgi:hypothetical protein
MREIESHTMYVRAGLRNAEFFDAQRSRSPKTLDIRCARPQDQRCVSHPMFSKLGGPMKTPVALALLAVVAAGCASNTPPAPVTPQAAIPSIPDWYTNLPKDQNYFYGRGTAQSRDLQVATDQAELSARNDLGSQMTIKVEGLGKRFTEQTGAGADAELLASFSQAQKQVVNTEIAGSRTVKSTVLPNGPTYQVFVLMELPIGKASEALMSKIKADQQMYTRFRATKAFEDLDAEVKKYDDWKKNQPPI